MEPKKFDPEGSGYDFAGARAAGVKPDSSGHWPSRDPKTGMILKGRKHPTFHKTQAAETRLGFKINKRNGRYFSQKEKGDVMNLGPGGMLPGGGATSTFNGVSPFVQGEWDWMQNPMMMQAMLGAGGMFGDQQQQPMMAPPQLGPMPMGRATPIQAPQMPQTPFQQRPPWYGGMFSG